MGTGMGILMWYKRFLAALKRNHDTTLEEEFQARTGSESEFKMSPVNFFLINKISTLLPSTGH